MMMFVAVFVVVDIVDAADVVMAMVAVALVVDGGGCGR